MALAAEDIVNMGLRDGGVPLRINDLYEGSDAARTALEVYGQARDELTRLTDWSFSRGTLALALLKGPPPAGGYNPGQPWTNAYPVPGFLFEYTFPADCLDVRSITEPPGPMPDLDPKPQLWRIDNDSAPNVSGNPPVASGPPAKVILCNVANAICIYRRQVTDPNEWEPGFIAALVASLGKKFSKAFGSDPNTVREESAEALGTTQTMSAVRG
jgi:hypothetical protein